MTHAVNRVITYHIMCGWPPKTSIFNALSDRDMYLPPSEAAASLLPMTVPNPTWQRSNRKVEAKTCTITKLHTKITEWNT